MKIYSVFDKVAEKSFALFASPNNGLAIRENARAIVRVMPLGDCELRCIGEIDDYTCRILPYDSFEVVDWDSYKFPENPIKPLPENSEVKPVSVANNTSVK